MAIELKGLYKYSGNVYVVTKDYNITIGTLKAGSRIYVYNVARAALPFEKLVIYCRDIETEHCFTMFEENFIEHVAFYERPAWMNKLDAFMNIKWIPYTVTGIMILLIVARHYILK